MTRQEADGRLRTYLTHFKVLTVITGRVTRRQRQTIKIVDSQAEVDLTPAVAALIERPYGGSGLILQPTETAASVIAQVSTQLFGTAEAVIGRYL